ncbi:hypothetical protein H4R27_002428 [Coemansia aciculifera]|uniref:Phytanoyl-CoA dioxygenase n=1 Tax=Coemansia pectinata TaxID=1052879 RepID=A0A9W8LEP3_9FUNG|nr:hypothetical protein GGI19_000209 [Coemansia pectinata]KAJ2883970.1 hypothetical protein H4R27_002428 [Coemansia aciculifera]
MFTDTHLKTFRRNGCAVIADFILPEQVSTLRQRIDELLRSFDPENHPLTTFATGQSQQQQPDIHIGDQYFFDSADKTSFFLEEGAIDNSSNGGRLTVDAPRAINKIGHGLHLTEPVFTQLTHSAQIKDIALKLEYKDPRVLQSMVICKQPGIGGAVPWHQDSTFLFTQPLSACGFWLALEDCTLDNGCLEYIPGSHLTTPVTRRFVRKQDNSGTEMVSITTPDNTEVKDISGNGVPIEVAAGSLVLINGQVLHRSSHNYSAKSRWIYTFHIVEGTAEYDQRNWLQMPAGAELTKL